MSSNPDLKLAKRVLDGDQRAFDVFFNSYYPRLYRFALVRLDNDNDLADDVAQLVLCQAISKIDTYRGEAPLFSWLCTFSRYEISKQRKARARAQGDRPMTEDDPAVKAALDSLLAASREDPDVSVYQSELRRFVIVAMDHLPSLYADVLEAKYVREESVADIAQVLGKSPKAAESILTRARVAFRDAFMTLVDEHRTTMGEQRGLTSILEY